MGNSSGNFLHTFRRIVQSFQGILENLVLQDDFTLLEVESENLAFLGEKVLHALLDQRYNDPSKYIIYCAD